MEGHRLLSPISLRRQLKLLRAQLVANSLKYWTQLGNHKLNIAFRVLVELLDALDFLEDSAEQLKDFLVPLVADLVVPPVGVRKKLVEC